jgi:hypothetical protein
MCTSWEDIGTLGSHGTMVMPADSNWGFLQTSDYLKGALPEVNASLKPIALSYWLFFPHHQKALTSCSRDTWLWMWPRGGLNLGSFPNHCH